jgi:BspA type Leucine rich repeat region (6 copies)
MKKIDLINLNNNKIQFLDSKTFVNLLNLKNISLNGNELERIEKDLFKDNTNLENVWLDNNNNIKSISYEVFDNKKNLDFVGLRNNICVDSFFWKRNDKTALDTMRSTLKENCKNGVDKKLYATPFAILTLAVLVLFL